MLDETEFLSDHGVRSLSRHHAEHPFVFSCHGETLSVGYEPAESQSALFGGNSNWRGPVWMPVNYLIIESLQKFHHYYGDDFKVECPTGSGRFLTINESPQELTRRLTRIFLPRRGRPAAGLRQRRKAPARPALPRLRSLLRVLSRRQRPRPGCLASDRLDRLDRKTPLAAPRRMPQCDLSTIRMPSSPRKHPERVAGTMICNASSLHSLRPVVRRSWFRKIAIEISADPIRVGITVSVLITFDDLVAVSIEDLHGFHQRLRPGLEKLLQQLPASLPASSGSRRARSMNRAAAPVRPPLMACLAAMRRAAASSPAGSERDQSRIAWLSAGGGALIRPSPQKCPSQGAYVADPFGRGGRVVPPAFRGIEQDEQSPGARDGDRVVHGGHPRAVQLARLTCVPGPHRKQQPRERVRLRVLSQKPDVREVRIRSARRMMSALRIFRLRYS